MPQIFYCCFCLLYDTWTLLTRFHSYFPGGDTKDLPNQTGNKRIVLFCESFRKQSRSAEFQFMLCKKRSTICNERYKVQKKWENEKKMQKRYKNGMGQIYHLTHTTKKPLRELTPTQPPPPSRQHCNAPAWAGP